MKNDCSAFARYLDFAGMQELTLTHLLQDLEKMRGSGEVGLTRKESLGLLRQVQQQLARLWRKLVKRFHLDPDAAKTTDLDAYIAARQRLYYLETDPTDVSEEELQSLPLSVRMEIRRAKQEKRLARIPHFGKTTKE